MERKIGEIFQYNGEWYQCLKGDCCRNCDFYDKFKDDICFLINNCSLSHRSDKTSVIFKKLEKVGEPYISSRNKKRYQLYRFFCLPITKDMRIEIGGTNCVGIEIKQNKEDMEQEIEYFGEESTKHSNSEKIGKNLKEFNLEAAKLGKPVFTRDGRKVRIICFDAKGKYGRYIVALVPSKKFAGVEDLITYPNNGNYQGGHENDVDLMLLPEKKEGWVNIDKGGSGKITVSSPYSTKEEAIHNDNETTIDTIKISWEE